MNSKSKSLLKRLLVSLAGGLLTSVVLFSLVKTPLDYFDALRQYPYEFIILCIIFFMALWLGQEEILETLHVLGICTGWAIILVIILSIIFTPVLWLMLFAVLGLFFFSLIIEHMYAVIIIGTIIITVLLYLEKREAIIKTREN